MFYHHVTHHALDRECDVLFGPNFIFIARETHRKNVQEKGTGKKKGMAHQNNEKALQKHTIPITITYHLIVNCENNVNSFAHNTTSTIRIERNLFQGIGMPKKTKRSLKREGIASSTCVTK